MARLLGDNFGNLCPGMVGRWWGGGGEDGCRAGGTAVRSPAALDHSLTIRHPVTSAPTIL